MVSISNTLAKVTGFMITIVIFFAADVDSTHEKGEEWS